MISGLNLNARVSLEQAVFSRRALLKVGAAAGSGLLTGIGLATEVQTKGNQSNPRPTGPKMNALLKEVLTAHGGLERWHSFTQISSDVVTGGFLWGMKGIDMDDRPRRITSQLDRQQTVVDGFGGPGMTMTYTPDKVVIRAADRSVVAQREWPRAAFAGHKWETKWDPLDLGYFNGYAMWTYYNSPFVFAEPDFEVQEIAPPDRSDPSLRALHVRFPKRVHTHTPEMTFYISADGLVVRQDYQVDVAGNSKAAHFISHYVDVKGIKIGSRRRVFVRGEDHKPQYDKNTVTADLSNVELI